jgi:hypothetical protein
MDKHSAGPPPSARYEGRAAAGLSGPYAADVAEWLAEGGHGDTALDFAVLLGRARAPERQVPLSAEDEDGYGHIVRAAAGLAGVTLGGEIPVSTVPGRPLTVRQQAVLAAAASFGITVSAAGSSDSLRRRGLAEKVPGWRWDSSSWPSWRLTGAGLAEAARALIIAARECSASEPGSA